MMETVKIALELMEQTVRVLRRILEGKHKADGARRVTQIWARAESQIAQAIARDEAAKRYDDSRG